MISVGLEVGELVFLRLEGFEPAWRQAVVAVSSRKGDRLICAVRVLDSEIEEISTTVSFFELANSKFILVKGNLGQMRRGCTHPLRALEVDPARILSRAKEVLETDSPQYLTASEDVAEPPARKKLQPNFELEDSDSSSEEDREDAVLQLLRKAERSMPEKGTASGSKERVSMTRAERYPLLTHDSKKTSASTSGYEAAVARLMTAGGQELQGDSLNALVQLELLKTLKGKGMKKKSFTLDLDEEDGEDTSSESDVVTKKTSGAGKALRDFRRGHKLMRRKPLKHVRKYITEIKEHMGVSSEQPYRLSDYSKKINWGRHKTLMRIHYAVSELLQVQLAGKPNQAALQSVQLLRALHQACLDEGSWRAAALLLAHQDPLERQRFGGEAEQLEQVASYLKAMEELEKRGRNPQNDPSTKKPNKGKGKKRHDQNVEDTAE